jgi:uncharacterized repeat protein (TIGR03803 family)
MRRRTLRTCIALLAVLCLLARATAADAAALETVLHTFDGLDGEVPNGNLVADGAGNLYGTTVYGSRWGYGTVFELSPPPTPGKPWTERVIYAFFGGLDGSGSGYGASASGGRFGGGVAYRLSPPRSGHGRWTQRVLHAFAGSPGDASPGAGLTFDSAGNLYGVAPGGGPKRCGTVFQLAPPARAGAAWSERTIYRFSNCTGRGQPSNGLTYYRGAIYGMTTFQVVGCVCSVFRLSPPPNAAGSWTYADLHDFGGPGDGDLPADAPTFDVAGNLYGTTESGGLGSCLGGGCGVVFRLSPRASGSGAWTEALLYAFSGGADGGAPLSSLSFDARGALYGTTVAGGTHQRGTVFRLAPQPGGTWTESVLHSFAGGSDGRGPQSGVLIRSGVLYGTTPFGGVQPRSTCPDKECGTVYDVVP